MHLIYLPFLLTIGGCLLVVSLCWIVFSFRTIACRMGLASRTSSQCGTPAVVKTDPLKNTLTPCPSIAPTLMNHRWVPCNQVRRLRPQPRPAKLYEPTHSFANCDTYVLPCSRCHAETINLNCTSAFHKPGIECSYSRMPSFESLTAPLSHPSSDDDEDPWTDSEDEAPHYDPAESLTTW